MEKQLRGVFTIPPVVYHEDYTVDYEATARTVRFCLDCGAHGLVIPVYATEYFVLTAEERKKLLEIAVKEVDGRIPVVAGVSAAYVGEAVELSRHANEIGASCVLAAPPHVVKVNNAEMFDYYRQINDAVNIPVFVQHIFPPLGTPMSMDFMDKLLTKLENVRYIKEESTKSLDMITREAQYQKTSDRLLGIMGGKGARILIEEYDRGICGTMPPSQFTDLVVDIWNLLEEGKMQEAYRMHALCLPAFTYGGTYAVGSYKHILKRRGVVDFAGCRPAGWPEMNDAAFRELDRIFELVQPMLRVKY